MSIVKDSISPFIPASEFRKLGKEGLLRTLDIGVSVLKDEVKELEDPVDEAEVIFAISYLTEELLGIVREISAKQIDRHATL